jgi:transcriptional regulator PpsR
MQEVLRSAPDAIVLTDDDGRIMAVNGSFLELAQLVAEEQVIGHSADRWLGRTGVDLSVLLTNLRDKSVVKLFSSTLVPLAGTPAQVEVSGCRLDEPDGPAFALFIRDVERRVTREHPVAAKLPSSIEQVTQRVGRVPLKELVRESTDLIEALCIETALEVTQDNRASAAELAGAVAAVAVRKAAAIQYWQR